MSLARTAGSSGALFTMAGEISNNVTWDEYIYFLEDGTGMVLTGLSFQLQFREGEGEDAVLTLSTSGGELVITNDDASSPTILRINVPYTTISGLDGEYIVDLVSKDVSDKLTHWAHGVVMFRSNPVAF
jgi:hypothetical protein